MKGYRTLVYFQEALDRELEVTLRARAIMHRTLRNLLRYFELGMATRMDAATFLDEFEDGYFDDPRTEAIRKELVNRSLALIADWQLGAPRTKKPQTRR